MNVLSDILCNSSPAILSSSYNGPLLSHDSPTHKAMPKQDHLMNSLQTLPTSDRIETNIFHNTTSSGHAHNNDATFMPPNYPISSHESEHHSDYHADPYQESVQSWFTNDFMKASEHMPPSVLPTVVDLYSSGHQSFLDMLEVGFPPEIINSNSMNCDIETNCMPNNDLVPVDDSQGFPCSVSMLISSFTDLQTPHMPLEKSNISCDKYTPSTMSTASTPSIINDMMTMTNTCNLNTSNHLLSLTDHMNEQSLQSAMNPVSLHNDQVSSHQIYMIPDKLPNITLNQLDSILRINNSLDDMPIMSTDLQNSISSKNPCNSFPEGPRIEACNENLSNLITCNDSSLSNINLTPFSSHQDMVEISRALPECPVVDHPLVNTFDSSIESACCFKCKYCSFISLNKDDVGIHVQNVHFREEQNYSTRSTHSSFYSNSNIPNSNPMPTNKEPLLSQPVAAGNQNAAFQYKEMVNAVDNNTSVLPNAIRLETSVPNPKPTENGQPSYLHLETLKKNDTSDISAKLNKKKPIPNIENIVPTVSGTQMLNERVINMANHLNQDRPSQNYISNIIHDEPTKKPNNTKKLNSNEVKSLTQQRRLSSHMKAWQKKIRREVGSYICEFKGCNVRFRALDNLEYHRKCHMAASGKFACPECGTNFDSWSSAAGHLWRQHSTDMELHACNICSFRTYSLSTLENLHKPIHLDERQFLCDICEKEFKTRKQLRNHRVIHDKRTNNPEKKFLCTLCSRPFLTKKYLRSHMNSVHHNIRSYSCSYCPYTTTKSSTLKMHIRQHKGEKPFACDQCSYRTSDHNTLRRHKYGHSGEKPYKCPYCTYACIQSSTYKTHLRKQHPNESEKVLIFSCSICPHKTIEVHNYMAHMAQHELKNKKRPLSSESEQPVNSAIPPLVEAVDISLSHGDHTFLGATKEKHSSSYMWTENNVVVDNVS